MIIKINLIWVNSLKTGDHTNHLFFFFIYFLLLLLIKKKIKQNQTNKKRNKENHNFVLIFHIKYYHSNKNLNLYEKNMFIQSIQDSIF